MSFSIVPNPAPAGSLVTGKLRYPGPVSPKPTDVHIDAQQPDGSWKPVTGYDHIPSGKDPIEGFELPFSSGNPHLGGLGEHILRVRWTLDGRPIGPSETAQLVLTPSGPGTGTDVSTPDDDPPKCGGDCYIIEYEMKPGVATSFQNDGDTDVTAMPGENSGIYNQLNFPDMRDAFDAAARKVQAKYKSYSNGCSGHCVCQKDEDARPRASTPWSVPVTATYTYPSGRTATITGAFEIKQLKTAGTCRPE